MHESLSPRSVSSTINTTLGLCARPPHDVINTARMERAAGRKRFMALVAQRLSFFEHEGHAILCALLAAELHEYFALEREQVVFGDFGAGRKLAAAHHA